MSDVMDTSEQFEALVEGAAEIIAVLAANGQVLYANRVAQEYGPPTGSTVWEDSPFMGRIHPDDRPGFTEQFRLVQTHRDAVVRHRFRIAKKIGPGRLRYRILEVHLENRLDDPRIQGVVAVGRDVTQRVATERALNTITKTTRALVSATTEQELLDQTCSTIVTMSGYQLAWIGRSRDDDERSVEILASAGARGYLDELKVSWAASSPYGNGPTGRALRTGQPQTIGSATTDDEFGPWRDLAAKFHLRSACALPFRVEGDTLWSALNIYSDETYAFDSAAVHELMDLANNLVFGLTRLRQLAKYTGTLHGTIEAVASAVEVRDPFTGGHQRRVAALTGELCQRLKLGRREAEGIVLGARVHDVGKVAIPYEILTTIRSLTDLERAYIEQHPEFGDTIFEDVTFPWPVRSYILEHHERLDGSGYPKGLRADRISRGAKVIAVADVVESMASRRPYRRTPGQQAALQEIKLNSGTKYDPDAVAACLAVFEDGFEFPDVHAFDAI